MCNLLVEITDFLSTERDHKPRFCDHNVPFGDQKPLLFTVL